MDLEAGIEVVGLEPAVPDTTTVPNVAAARTRAQTPTMTEIRIAILASCRPEWCKFAMVIALAHRQLALPDDESSYDLLDSEIAALVESGELQAVGDILDWRHSEVRLCA